MPGARPERQHHPTAPEHPNDLRDRRPAGTPHPIRRGRSGTTAAMERVVVLGRGGAGKSTLAAALGVITGLPVVELDKHFWGPNLEATPPEQWAAVQDLLARADRWIMDG